MIAFIFLHHIFIQENNKIKQEHDSYSRLTLSVYTYIHIQSTFKFGKRHLLGSIFCTKAKQTSKQ